jgi:hypothetical protein
VGHRHRPPDRPAVAAALTTTCRRAYMAGKDRGASRYAPIGASINGVEVLGARDLTRDMLLLRLAVPSRTTELEASELLAAGSALGHDVSAPQTARPASPRPPGTTAWPHGRPAIVICR